MKPFIALASIAVLGVALVGCSEFTPSSDEVQQEQQERILKEGNAQTGMPAIKNFRERKLLKQMIEMRDQEGLVTYTYTVPETTGRPVFFCNSIGYGLSAATQYTNPQKIENPPSIAGYYVIPQADPNGLYSPSSTEGTFVVCADPNGSGKTGVLYVEPRIITSPFKL